MKPRILNTARLSFPLASAIAALLALPSAHAAIRYWDGAANANWSTASAWSTASGATTPDPSSAPGGSDDTIFNITTANTASSNVSMANGGRSALSVTLNTTGTTNFRAGGASTSASTFTIGAGGITMNAGTAVIGQTPSSYGNITVALGANQTWTNDSTGLLTVVGPVTGASRQLTKSGTGQIRLNGANTYSGATIVDGGDLLIGNYSGLNSTSGITISGGSASLQLVQVGTGSTSNTINKPVSLHGFLRTAGGSGTNTLNLTWGGDITLAGAGTIWNNGNSIFDIDGQVDLGANTLTFQTDRDGSRIDGNIIGTGGSLIKTGSLRNLTLTGSNTFSGDITVNAGTLIGAGATNSPGITVFGARDNTRTINVNTGGTLRFDSGNVLGANHTATTAPTLVINSGGTVTNASPATNNALNNVQLNGGTLTATTGSASGYGAWNLNGTVTSSGASTISTSDAVNGTVMLKVAGTTGFDVTSGTLTVSAPLIDNMNDSNTGSLSKSGAGTMVLSGTNTYTGTTSVTGGTLTFSGSGDSNSSSGITVNGADAKLLQTSSVAIAPAVALTQGTLTGSGTVNAVNVGDATGGIVSNNNGVAGAALTIGNLTFSGAATVNTFSDGASAPIVTTTLASNAAGVVTINPSAAIWSAGTYDLISYGGGSIGGAGFSQFALGTVTGISPRQSKSLGNSGTAITLTVGNDDTPYWVGDGDGKWNLASTNNWKLSSNNSYTTFLAGDNVLFNDNATGSGPIAVDIDTDNVTPTSTTFNHSAKDYVLGGAFGISSGSLTKSGSGTLTIANSNSYTGNTVISGGVLDVSTDGAQLYSGPSGISAVVTVTNGGVLVVKNYGQSAASGLGSTSLGNLNNGGGQVVLDGGTLRFNNETAERGRKTNIGDGGGTLEVVNNSALTLNSTGTFIFSGANTLTLTGDSTSSGTIEGVIAGTGVSLVKSGDATWTLSGNNTYTGTTSITGGTLVMATSNRIPNSSKISIAGGARINFNTGGNVSFTLSSGQNVEGTGTGTGNFNTGNNAASGLVTTGNSIFSHADTGTLALQRLDIRGAGNQMTGGNIQSGVAATRRGLLVGNNTSGDFTISGGTFTSIGGNLQPDCIGANSASGTLNISGGAYINQGTLSLGVGSTTHPGGTFNVNSGSATIGTLLYNASSTGGQGIVNLNGGTLTIGAMTSTSGETKEFNFDGGQFVAGGGLTFPSDVTANVKNGGAKIDTNGFSATVSSPMVNFGGTSTGGLTKSGMGTLTLSGNNNYAGGTSVTGGTLRFSTVVASATDVTVAGGTEAGALVAADNARWINSGSLTLQNSGAVLVDYSSTTPTTDSNFTPVSVTNFAINSTPGVRLAGASLPSLQAGNTYPLVTWSGTGPSDGSAFTLLTHRLTGTFSVASNTLSLTVTSNATNAPISWNAGDGNWDTLTSNWVDSNSATTTYFDTLDAVLFGDASGANGNPLVTLATPISPLGVTMNTSGRNYTVSGAGSIGGSGGLTLPGTNVGTFTLATANNTFSGGTVVLGGTLALGHATDTLPDSGAVMLDGATAVLGLGSNSDTVGAISLKNGASITGSGTLTGSSYAFESGSVSASLAGAIGLSKTTEGTVTLSGANSYTGTTTVGAGTLILSGANTTTGSTALSTGATLVLANTAAVQSTSGMTLNIGTTLRLATDAAFTTLPTFGASSGASAINFISDRATPGAGLVHGLGTPNLGANTFNFTSGANVTSGTAGISFDGVNMTSGSAGTAVLNPTTTTLTITGGVTSQANNVARTLQLDGTGTGHSIGGVITQSVANALSLTKSNTSTWTLSGANSYSGATTIAQGTLAFSTNDQSLTGGLTFGSANGSTDTGSLDLTNASATFGGVALVRTNNVTPNTITIGATRSLTLNGGLTLGYDAGGGTGATNSNLTVTGAGSLAVNGTTINVSVNQAATNAGYWSDPTLDVSGLAAFSTDVTNFNIGVGTTTQGPGAVLLSDTANTVIATTLTAGNTGGNNGRGTGLLVLGAGTNVIQADTINIGRSKSVPGGSTGVVRFASQDPGSPGTVTIADRAGTGRANIDIANQGATATGGGATGNLDLRGHVATVSAGTVAIGSVTAASNSGGPNGMLSFDAGTFDVNTLNMGTKSGNSTGTASATVNIGGGTFTVNNAFTMGSQTGAGASNATVNLTDGTLSSLVNIVKGTGSVTSTINLAGGTLDLNGNAIGSGTEAITLNAESGTLKDVATINGTGGLTKTTAGTLIVEGTNPYSGDTTVSEGTLTISSAASPANANAINDGSIVSIAATGAILNLTYTGTDVVNELYIGGVQQAAGVWGAVGSGAPKTDARITGTGTLTVTTGSAGFSSWITGSFANGNVPGDKQGPNDDPDNDGVTNLVEYAIAGQDPTVANPSVGTYTGTSLSFDKRQPLASDITYAIQQSTDLGVGDTWEEVSGGTYTNNSTNISYSFTPGTPAKDFFRLSVIQNP